MAPVRFTVLTPTYNRAHTLGRLYESLCAQTFRDFEWVIVDDGSSDATKDLVSSWKPFFPIRYFWKSNGGKHTAINLGVKEARGELVVSADSDDAWKPEAFERFDFHWRHLPEPERFSTISATTCNSSGNLICDPWPFDYVDAFSFADQIKFRGKADRCGVNRRDVLIKFPLPEYGEKGYVPEGIVWNRMARHYACRFISEPLMIVYYQPQGITLNKGTLRNWKAAETYYRELFLSPVPLKEKAKAAIKMTRYKMLAALQSRPSI